MMGLIGGKKRAWCLAGGVAALLAPPLALTGCGGGGDDTVVGMRARLDGQQERPTPRATPARGAASVRLNAADDTVEVVVNTRGLTNVVAAHVHVGSAAEAGPVIFDLFLPADGPFPATLRKTLTPANLKPGTSPSGITANSFDEALDRIAEGNTYINIHTNDGVAPADSGPGDFPGGEIRGQIVR